MLQRSRKAPTQHMMEQKSYTELLKFVFVSRNPGQIDEIEGKQSFHRMASGPVIQ